MNDSSGSNPNSDMGGLKEVKPRNERVAYVDIIKAIAIVYVILVHTNFANGAIKPWLMRIVMCVFFFVSGVFLKGNGDMTPSQGRTFIAKKFQSFMVPYFLWALIFSKFNFTNLIKIIYGSYQMIGSSGSSRVLWFLPVMFLCFVMYICCRLVFQNRFSTAAKITMIAITFGIAFLLPKLERGYPWGINSAFSAFGFLLMGNLTFPLLQRFHQYGSRSRAGLCVGIVAACISFAGTQFYRLNLAPVSMATGKYGNVALFLIVAVSGIIFTAVIAVLIDQLPFLKLKGYISYIGRNTFSIFVLHLLGVRIAEILFHRVHMPNWAGLILACVVAIAVSLTGNWVISRFAPVLLGKSEQR
ncbi:MAG: acyltransferase [Clostridia bacterium]|nr:acyltransferase [Clostridia bacterium]